MFCGGNFLNEDLLYVAVEFIQTEFKFQAESTIHATEPQGQKMGTFLKVLALSLW